MIVRDRREKTAKRAGALSRPGPVELLFFVLLFGLDDLFGLGDLDVYDGLVLGYILVVYVVRLDYDLGAVGNLALEDHLAHRVLDHALKDSLKGPRAERRVVTSVGELVQSLASELYGHLAIGELLAQAPYLDLDDVAHVRALKLVKDDGLVDPVEKLGTEDLTKLRRDPSLHLLVGEPSLVVTEAQGLGLVDVLGTDVGGHDEDHVLEVHCPALRVGEHSIFQDLEEDVEDIRVGFLDLVEEDHAVRTAPDLLGELAALVVADVARGGTDESADRVPRHVLGHVESDHGLLIPKEVLGKRPRELGLAHARGPEEDERAAWAVRVFYAGEGAPDGAGDGLDSLVLPDGGLALAVGALAPALLELAALQGELALIIPQARGLLELLAVDGGLFLLPHLGQLVVDLLVVRRRGHRLDPHLGRRLVYEVYGLIWQEAVRDVAVAELGGGLQSLVGYLDLVMLLVAVPESL